jgi:hypothetical protein
MSNQKIATAVALSMVSGLALATDPTIDYAAMVSAAVVQVGLAVAAGVTLFGLVFGLKVGLAALKKFAQG